MEFEYKNKQKSRTEEHETKKQEGAKFGKLKEIKRDIENGGSKSKMMENPL